MKLHALKGVLPGQEGNVKVLAVAAGGTLTEVDYLKKSVWRAVKAREGYPPKQRA